MTVLAPIIAAVAIVGPTAIVSTLAGWARCGYAPWTRDFWAS